MTVSVFPFSTVKANWDTFGKISLCMLCLVETILHGQKRFRDTDSSGPYHLLSRSEQVTFFRLFSGHNRLSHHLPAKFRTGLSEPCPCQTGSMATEHLLPACLLYNNLRCQLWLRETVVVRKLFGTVTAPSLLSCKVECEPWK